MLELVWLVPAFPLLGFLVLLAGGRVLGEPRAGWLATLMSAGSFAATLVVFAGMLGEDAHDREFQQVLFDSLGGPSLAIEQLLNFKTFWENHDATWILALGFIGLSCANHGSRRHQRLYGEQHLCLG